MRESQQQETPQGRRSWGQCGLPVQRGLEQASVWVWTRSTQSSLRVRHIRKSGHPRQSPGQSLAPGVKGRAELEPKVWLGPPIGIQHAPGTLGTQPCLLRLHRPQGFPTLGPDGSHTWAGRASIEGKLVG